MDNQQFKSAQDALIFAFRFSGQAYERPLINRMADDPVVVAGTGLSGLDGAGQAAMIWAQVLKLRPIHQFVLYASYGPKEYACTCGHPCCKGWAANPCWDACIVKIEEEAITKALSGCLVHRALRRGIVRGLFGDKDRSLVSLAEKSGVTEKTAIGHRQRIRAWLFGSKADGNEIGVKSVAESCIHQMLRDCGILETEEVC